MEPKRLTDEEFESLPAGVRIVYAEGQPQYRLLPAVRLDSDDRRVISCWSLTDDERAAIANGADLYLQQLTFGIDLQPILPTIGLPQFCPTDAVGSSQPIELSEENIDHAE